MLKNKFCLCMTALAMINSSIFGSVANADSQQSTNIDALLNSANSVNQAQMIQSLEKNYGVQVFIRNSTINASGSLRAIAHRASDCPPMLGAQNIMANAVIYLMEGRCGYSAASPDVAPIIDRIFVPKNLVATSNPDNGYLTGLSNETPRVNLFDVESSGFIMGSVRSWSLFEQVSYQISDADSALVPNVHYVGRQGFAGGVATSLLTPIQQMPVLVKTAKALSAAGAQNLNATLVFTSGKTVSLNEIQSRPEEAPQFLQSVRLELPLQNEIAPLPAPILLIAGNASQAELDSGIAENLEAIQGYKLLFDTNIVPQLKDLAVISRDPKVLEVTELLRKKMEKELGRRISQAEFELKVLRSREFRSHLYLGLLSAFHTTSIVLGIAGIVALIATAHVSPLLLALHNPAGYLRFVGHIMRYPIHF